MPERGAGRGVVRRAGSGTVGRPVLSRPRVSSTGMRRTLSLYEDVASSIGPGQRCHMQERLSTANSGLGSHRGTGFSLLLGRTGNTPWPTGEPMVDGEIRH